jgi:hypothetical protein
MVPSSPIASKESQDASLFQRMYMEIDLRLQPAADLGLPVICDFQKTITAECQMPDAG